MIGEDLVHDLSIHRRNFSSLICGQRLLNAITAITGALKEDGHLPQAHTRPLAILGDEHHAAALKGRPKPVAIASMRVSSSSLEIGNRLFRDPRAALKVILAPTEESPGRAGLCRGYGQGSYLKNVVTTCDTTSMR